MQKMGFSMFAPRAALVTALLASTWGCAPKQPAASEASAAPASTPTDRGGADGTPAPAATTDAESEPGAAESSNAESSTTAPPPAADPNGETRTTQVVADYVKAHRDEVRTCYDDVEKQYPGIHGDIVIRFVIAPDGRVQSLSFAHEESTLKYAEIANCMMAKMKGWKFPPSSLGMESRIGYPFNFNPKRRPPEEK